MTYEELWLVDEDEKANQLMKVGWKFIQVVYEDREVTEWKGFWTQTKKTVATAKVSKFLMGRPKGIEPRGENEWGSIEDLKEYIERIEGEKKE